MHNESPSDDVVNTSPADTALPDTQAPKEDLLPNQADVDVVQMVAFGETAERQEQGGFVKLDEHGMVLHFVPLRERHD